MLFDGEQDFLDAGRDNATPFSAFFGRVNHKHRNPFNAIMACGVICTVLGCIYVGNQTAFNDFVSSSAVLSSLSYLAAILLHLIGRRASVEPGWFWMKGPIGFVVNAIASLYFQLLLPFLYAGECTDYELYQSDHRWFDIDLLWCFGFGDREITLDPISCRWRVPSLRRML